MARLRITNDEAGVAQDSLFKSCGFSIRKGRRAATSKQDSPFKSCGFSIRKGRRAATSKSRRCATKLPLVSRVVTA